MTESVLTKEFARAPLQRKSPPDINLHLNLNRFNLNRDAVLLMIGCLLNMSGGFGI